MNMTVLDGADKPDVSDVDPARRITLFKKTPVGVSHKCPILSQINDMHKAYEYGFYYGGIEIESPLQVIKMKACKSLIEILEKSPQRHTIIENIFQNQR